MYSNILNILPHRYPFLLVDRIISANEGIIHAIKNVTYNENFFTGHFPNEPVMPGVLIIEALAQTATLLTTKAPSTISYLTGIQQASFRRKVIPGDQLHLHVEKVGVKMGMWQIRGKALVDNMHLAAECMLTALEQKKEVELKT